MDDNATMKPPVLRLSTDAVEVRHRASLIGDMMGRKLAGGEIRMDKDASIFCDWRLAQIGAGTVLCQGQQGGFAATRDTRALDDDDADFSIFFLRDGEVPFEQNERRSVVRAGQALLVAHRHAVSSEWQSAAFAVLRLPRAAISNADLFDRAGGTLLSTASGAMQLLDSYVRAVGPLFETNGLPAFVDRHLAELAEQAVRDTIGAGTTTATEGKQAARLIAIQEAIARRYRDPGLSMASIAASIGLSERAAYMVLEENGLRYSHLVQSARLNRAYEQLRSGYAGRLLELALDVGFSDLSHFNRLFRARFGMTPSEARRPG